MIGACSVAHFETTTDTPTIEIVFTRAIVDMARGVGTSRSSVYALTRLLVDHPQWRQTRSRMLRLVANLDYCDDAFETAIRSFATEIIIMEGGSTL